jgi:hypothetical protein
MREPLEKFGAFFVQNLRDKMLYQLEMLLRGAWKAPDLLELQKKLSSFGDAEKQVVRDLADQMITAGMHDLLFALQEEADAEGAIRLWVDGVEVAKLSDGLHGEIFGDEGWIVRYSAYPADREIEGSRWAKEFIEKMAHDDDKGDD